MELQIPVVVIPFILYLQSTNIIRKQAEVSPVLIYLFIFFKRPMKKPDKSCLKQRLHQMSLPHQMLMSCRPASSKGKKGVVKLTPVCFVRVFNLEVTYSSIPFFHLMKEA